MKIQAPLYLQVYIDVNMKYITELTVNHNKAVSLKTFEIGFFISEWNEK